SACPDGIPGAEGAGTHDTHPDHGQPVPAPGTALYHSADPVRPPDQASLSTLRKLRNDYAEQMWQAYIPIDTKLRDASLAGVVPSQLEPNARGVLAYRALLRYLLVQSVARSEETA